jgi:hypothetical protein
VLRTNSLHIPTEIVFYLPEFMTGIGGVEMLVLNMVRGIVRFGQPHTTTRVICPAGSFVHGELSREASRAVDVECWGQTITPMADTSLLVAWGGYGTLARLRPHNPRLLIWSMAPGAPVSHLDRLPRPFRLLHALKRRRVHQITNYLVANESLVFMDQPNRTEMERRCQHPLPTAYLPLPMEIQENFYLACPKQSSNSDRLRLTWVGRSGTPWKVIPLARFLDSATLPTAGAEIVVFTDRAEPYDECFHQFRLHERLKIRYRFGVAGETLRRELASISDVHLGMGTAVLEGASVGIPSLCIDPQTSLEPMAAWSWLHERREFNVGDFEAPPEHRRPFDFNSLWPPTSTLRRLSQEAFAYVQGSHELSRVVQKLMNLQPRGTLQGYLNAHGVLLRTLGALSALRRG